MDTCGYMWIHVDTCGYMWIHVDSCGICGCMRLIWIPCIIYAYSWGSPHTSRQAGRVRGQSSAWRALFECQKGTDLVTAFNDYRIVGDKSLGAYQHVRCCSVYYIISYNIMYLCTRIEWTCLHAHLSRSKHDPWAVTNC